MAYDPTCQGTVLVGGRSGPWNCFADTWVWNGSAWTRINPSNPWGTIAESALVFDSNRQTLVLFEGTCAPTPWIGTWTGVSGVCGTWTQSNRSGGPPNQFQRMAYDTLRQRAVIFGGQDAQGNGQTWEWDGSRWIEKFPNLPIPLSRSAPAMAYDIARGVTVLFSGGVFNPLPGTWLWNGLTWSPASPPASPPPRWSHAMAYDAARQNVVLFGGSGIQSCMQGTWTWNGTTWTQWTGSMPTPGRQDHAMAYDAARQQVVLFGGDDCNGNDLNSTWLWNGSSWTPALPPVSPLPRRRHAMAYDASRRVVVLFAGENRNLGPFNDLWDWNGTNWVQQTALGPVQVVRGQHAMAYDAARQRILVYGGWNPNFPGTNLFDTWELVPDTFQAVRTATPPLQVTLTLRGIPVAAPPYPSFQFVVSAAGTVPGIGFPPVTTPPFGTAVVPVNFDQLVLLSLCCLPFAGSLGPTGTVSVTLPIPFAPLGIPVHAAAVVSNPQTGAWTLTPEAFFWL